MYQSLEPLWPTAQYKGFCLQRSITNIHAIPYNHSVYSLLGCGTITKVNYNQMYQSLQPFRLQLTNLEGMITWVNQTYQSLQSVHSLPTWRVPVPTTILPIAYQIWADGFKRWLNGRDHTTILPTVNQPCVDNKKRTVYVQGSYIKKGSHIPVKLNLRKQTIDEFISQYIAYHSSLKETLFTIFMLSYNSTVCMHTILYFVIVIYL